MDAMYEKHDLEYDPIYWAMLFDFGRARVRKDKVIASHWKGVYLDYIESPVWKARARDSRAPWRLALLPFLPGPIF